MKIIRKYRSIGVIQELQWLLFSLCILTSINLPKMVSASDGFQSGKLTDIFFSDTFSGNMAFLTKLNWIGELVSDLISLFGLLGLVTVILRILISLLYLSGKNFWNRVDEVKRNSVQYSGPGSNAPNILGWKGIVGRVWEPSNSSGLDVVLEFLLSLLPNIKEYSEYSESNLASNTGSVKNLKDTDNVTQYLLKSAIVNVMIIFAFTMVWNTTLLQAYGTVVDAMGVVADNFVESDLNQLVERALNSGSGYNFAYSASGTTYGSKKQAIMKKLYTKTLQNTSDLSTSVKNAVGQSIDTNWSSVVDMVSFIKSASTSMTLYDGNHANPVVYNVFKFSNTDNGEYSASVYCWNDLTIEVTDGGGYSISGVYSVSVVGSDDDDDGDTYYQYRTDDTVTVANGYVGNNSISNSMITDSMAENLEYSAVVNSVDSYDGAISMPLTSCGLSTSENSTASEKYIHLMITKKSNSNEHSYLTVNKDSGTAD